MNHAKNWSKLGARTRNEFSLKLIFVDALCNNLLLPTLEDGDDYPKNGSDTINFTLFYLTNASIDRFEIGPIMCKYIAAESIQPNAYEI